MLDADDKLNRLLKAKTGSSSMILRNLVSTESNKEPFCANSCRNFPDVPTWWFASAGAEKCSVPHSA